MGYPIYRSGEIDEGALVAMKQAISFSERCQSDPHHAALIGALKRGIN